MLVVSTVKLKDWRGGSVLAALKEDLVSIPSTHKVPHSHMEDPTLSSGGNAV